MKKKSTSSLHPPSPRMPPDLIPILTFHLCPFTFASPQGPPSSLEAIEAPSPHGKQKRPPGFSPPHERVGFSRPPWRSPPRPAASPSYPAAAGCPRRPGAWPSPSVCRRHRRPPRGARKTRTLRIRPGGVCSGCTAQTEAEARAGSRPSRRRPITEGLSPPFDSNTPKNVAAVETSLPGEPRSGSTRSRNSSAQQPTSSFSRSP